MILTKQEISVAKPELRARVKQAALSTDGMIIKEWVDLRRQELYHQIEVASREDLPVLQGQLKELSSLLDQLGRK